MQAQLLCLFSFTSLSLSYITIPKAPFYFLRVSDNLLSSHSLLSVRSDETIGIVDINMPDRDAFRNFFNAMKASGAKRLSLDSFLNHDDVKILVEHGSISLTAVKRQWLQSLKSDNGLNEDDAYNVLCSVLSSSNKEELSYLEGEFLYLSGGLSDKLLSYDVFLKWDEIRNFISDELATENDIQQLWIDVAGSTLKSINLKEFLQLNEDLSTLFEKNAINNDSELSVLLDNISTPALSQSPTIIPSLKFSQSVIKLEDSSTSNDEDVDEDEDNDESDDFFESYDIHQNAWDVEHDPKEALEDSFVNYLEQFYRDNADTEGLSYLKLDAWKDLKDILAEGQVDDTCLRDLWLEALDERKDCRKSGKIDLDTFLRLNIRLDAILHEVSDVLDNISSGEFEVYHKKEFEMISFGRDLLTFDQLLQWNDLNDLIEQGSITMEQIRSLWKKLPREVLRSYVVQGGNILSGEAINLESFLAFSASLHELNPDYNNE